MKKHTRLHSESGLIRSEKRPRATKRRERRCETAVSLLNRRDIKQMKQREQLLNTYGFDVVDTDQDGNLIYREKKVILVLIIDRRRKVSR